MYGLILLILTMSFSIYVPPFGASNENALCYKFRIRDLGLALFMCEGAWVVPCVGTGNGIGVGCLPVSSGVFRKENDHWLFGFGLRINKRGLKYIFPSC